MDFIKSVFKGLFWLGIIFFILGTYVGYEAAVAITYSQLKKENPEIAAKFNKGIEKNMFVKLDTWIVNL